jgi:formate hydrogenlyase subunit 6/NADH:ubiquinone oxidoreductase subunit I
MINPAGVPMIRRSLRNLFSRPATRLYPRDVRPRFEGARGTIEFDLDTCNFCGLCARRCPAVALVVSREERTFAIEELRCVSCGVCVDVCARHSLVISADPPRVLTTGDAGPDDADLGRRTWLGEEPVRRTRAARPDRTIPTAGS